MAAHRIFPTYPGTLSLRATTLMSAVEDIIRSLYGQCFRRILILNGHGGNSPGRSKLREIVNEIPELQVVWYDWWELPAIEMIAQKMDIKPNHANWLEAFPFTIVSELPEGEKNPPRLPSIASAELSRKFLRDGSFGGQYRVEDSIMQEIFNAVLQDILEILKFEQEIP